MSKQYKYNHKLQIAGIMNDAGWHRMNVWTLMQSPGTKQPSVNAYLGARYSRSADSVFQIAEEVMEKGTDAAARLESIFHGYGHKSVGDMADLFICFENVPMISAMRLFNMNPVLAGQERSTRFQNFEDPQYINIPTGLDASPELREEYDSIIHQWMAHYREMLPKTKDKLDEYFMIDQEEKQQASALQARTFDTVRYFLPLGLQTSLGFVMSARSWCELISYLNGSNQMIDNDLGSMLYELLTSSDELTEMGYIPEADGLIKHTEPNRSRIKMFEDAIKYLREAVSKNESTERIEIPARIGQYLNICSGGDPIDSFVHHLQLLDDPLALAVLKLSMGQRRELGDIFFRYHDHHNLAGNMAQSGAYLIDGMADQGVLKDLNRHRSFERFVPLWENVVNMSRELDRDPVSSFFLCEYLYIEGFQELRTQYEERMTGMYERIKAWHGKAVGELGEDASREFTRYLLPHAHSTRYQFYASPDDMQYTINLRSRNGGHIAYRKHVYDWLGDLVILDPFWKGLLGKLPKVDAGDRGQFVDRT